MHWEKKITIRITFRRVVGAILAASTAANLVIVGAVVAADLAASTPTVVSTSITPLWTATLFLPTAETGAVNPITATLNPESTPIDTFTPTETSTPTPWATPTDPPPLMVCVKRFYWPGYRVRAGDTLFRIALSSGTTVNELMLANCRADDRLFIGELIYVPRLWSDPSTITPTPTPTGSATPTPTGTQPPVGIPTDTQTPTYTPTTAPTDTPTATPTATQTFSPPPTDTPTSTLTPTIPSAVCDRARFISDVNVPLGTRMLPGTIFTKTWRVMNFGSCTWTQSYQVTFSGGEQMGALASSSLQQNVASGQSIDISVRMIAPRAPGIYLSYWMLKNANGALFDEPLLLEIIVSDAGSTLTVTPTSTPDFTLTFVPGVVPSLITAP